MPWGVHCPFTNGLVPGIQTSWALLGAAWCSVGTGHSTCMCKITPGPLQDKPVILDSSRSILGLQVARNSNTSGIFFFFFFFAPVTTTWALLQTLISSFYGYHNRLPAVSL